MIDLSVWWTAKKARLLRGETKLQVVAAGKVDSFAEEVKALMNTNDAAVAAAMQAQPEGSDVPPTDDAFVAIGATRLDGELQTVESKKAAVDAWNAALAAKAPPLV